MLLGSETALRNFSTAVVDLRAVAEIDQHRIALARRHDVRRVLAAAASIGFDLSTAAFGSPGWKFTISTSFASFGISFWIGGSSIGLRGGAIRGALLADRDSSF